jgi:integrase
VLHLHRCLHTAFERAVRWRLLAVNPMNGVEAPSVPRTEAGFLVPEEAVRLLDVIRGSEFELPILVGLYGGLRPSEYLALRWADLDGTNGELRVTQTVSRVRNDRVTEWDGVEVEGFTFGPTKTHRSMRPVAIPEELVALLLAWRPVQAEVRLQCGPTWLDLGLIFTDPAGRPLDIGRLRGFLYGALTRAKVRRRKLYGLRHTMATLMLLRRESPKVVAARLGHANETLVLRTYGHLVPGMDRDAADRLAETLREAQFTRSAHEGQPGRGA